MCDNALGFGRPAEKQRGQHCGGTPSQCEWHTESDHEDGDDDVFVFVVVCLLTDGRASRRLTRLAAPHAPRGASRACGASRAAAARRLTRLAARATGCRSPRHMSPRHTSGVGGLAEVTRAAQPHTACPSPPSPSPRPTASLNN